MNNEVLSIREVTDLDYEILAINLRWEDAEEVRAWGHGDDIAGGIYDSVQSSTESFTFLLDNEPVGIFGYDEDGVEDVLGEDGIVTANVWALGTDKLYSIPKIMMRTAKKILQLLDKNYEMTFCYVHDKNSKHHKWLEAMGYKLDMDTTINIEETGEQFILGIRLAPCA